MTLPQVTNEKGAVDTRPPLSGILASHGTSVKRPGGCLAAATDDGSVRDWVARRAWALALVVRDWGSPCPRPASWLMMFRMPVLVWLGTLAIVPAVSLVAAAPPHVRRRAT